MHSETRRTRPNGNFLQNLLEAQKLAFAPFLFQAAAAALETGFLEAVVKAPGRTEAHYAEAVKLTPYAVRVLTDLLVPAGILRRIPSAEGEDGLDGTALADLLLYDPMTRANFFFSKDVNYAALGRLTESLTEGRPAGLEVFNPDWKTVYPHLPELPEEAKRSWFAFDHFHSDRAYEAALAALDLWAKANRGVGFRHLVDIGGNTGRFTAMFLRRSPEARATLVDLPVETDALHSRPELSDVSDRIAVRPIDWLTEEPLTGTDEGDLYWMSQFLDCFSFEEAASILRRTRAAMKPDARLAVLEPVVDEQRHPAAELSLAATSLYFTAVANGNSGFFRGADLRRLFTDAGFALEAEVPNLGISHTLFLLKSCA